MCRSKGPSGDARMLTLPGERGHPRGIQPRLAGVRAPRPPSSPVPVVRQAPAGGCFLSPVAAVLYGPSPAASQLPRGVASARLPCASETGGKP